MYSVHARVDWASEISVSPGDDLLFRLLKNRRRRVNLHYYYYYFFFPSKRVCLIVRDYMYVGTYNIGIVSVLDYLILIYRYTERYHKHVMWVFCVHCILRVGKR